MLFFSSTTLNRPSAWSILITMSHLWSHHVRRMKIMKALLVYYLLSSMPQIPLRSLLIASLTNDDNNNNATHISPFQHVQLNQLDNPELSSKACGGEIQLHSPWHIQHTAYNEVHCIAINRWQSKILTVRMEYHVWRKSQMDKSIEHKNEEW